MIKTIFKCPNCSKALNQGVKQYFCPNGHNFDIARKGYVNLLLSSHIGAGNPGDSKEMLQSRRDFLEKGYYQQFSDKLNSIVYQFCVNSRQNNSINQGASKHSKNNTRKEVNIKEVNIYDAGCGEGYYISRLKNDLENQNQDFSCFNFNFYGTDVARDAVNYASGRDKQIRFAVASSYHIPILDNTVNYLLCIFAPRDEQEFRRIMKPNGKLIVAVPGARHLYTLKKLMYQEPEEIGQKGTVRNGFRLLEETNVNYNINLTEKQDIINLFKMTPYSRHANIESINKVEELNTEVDINILVYEKT